MGNRLHIESSQDLLKLIRSEYSETLAVQIGTIDEEIAALEEEMGSIVTDRLSWDVSDYVVVFLAGLVGGLADLVVGKPGGYPEPKIKDDSFFGLGKWLKEYDIKNNPIDKQIPGAPVGDHRLYSYGHDLLRIMDGIRLIMAGKGPVGISGTGGKLILESVAEGYPGYDPFKAAMILLLHLFKDFWTARSLPIPGSTWIAELNGDKMPDLIDDLYNRREVNLRQLTGQAMSIAVIEISVRLTCFLKYRNTNVTDHLVENKRDTMLLVAHSVALLFNLGKVVVTKNPFLINAGQVLQVVRLAFRVIKESADVRHGVHLNTAISNLQTGLHTLRTAVLLEKAVVVTSNAGHFFDKQFLDFDLAYQVNQTSAARDFAELEKQIAAMGDLAQKLRSRRG